MNVTVALFVTVRVAVEITVTVDVPCVNVPVRVNKGLDVPLSVICDAFAKKVPFVLTLI